jgi:hypothetical protein
MDLDLLEVYMNKLDQFSITHLIAYLSHADNFKIAHRKGQIISWPELKKIIDDCNLKKVK